MPTIAEKLAQAAAATKQRHADAVEKARKAADAATERQARATADKVARAAAETKQRQDAAAAKSRAAAEATAERQARAAIREAARTAREAEKRRKADARRVAADAAAAEARARAEAAAQSRAAREAVRAAARRADAAAKLARTETREASKAAKERRARLQQARDCHLILPPEFAATLTPQEAAMFPTDPVPSLLAHVQRKHPRDLARQMAYLLELAADIPAPASASPEGVLEAAEALRGVTPTRGEFLRSPWESEDDDIDDEPEEPQ